MLPFKWKYGFSGNNYRVAMLSKSYFYRNHQAIVEIDRTDGRTHHNYRKALLKKNRQIQISIYTYQSNPINGTCSRNLQLINLIAN